MRSCCNVRKPAPFDDALDKLRQADLLQHARHTTLRSWARHQQSQLQDRGQKSQGPIQGDARNHGLQDPYVYVVFWTPISCPSCKRPAETKKARWASRCPAPSSSFSIFNSCLFVPNMSGCETADPFQIWITQQPFAIYKQWYAKPRLRKNRSRLRQQRNPLPKTRV